MNLLNQMIDKDNRLLEHVAVFGIVPKVMQKMQSSQEKVVRVEASYFVGQM